LILRWFSHWTFMPNTVRTVRWVWLGDINLMQWRCFFLLSQPLFSFLFRRFWNSSATSFAIYSSLFKHATIRTSKPTVMSIMSSKRGQRSPYFHLFSSFCSDESCSMTTVNSLDQKSSIGTPRDQRIWLIRLNSWSYFCLILSPLLFNL
jgi:hypothetical protein